jgi:hypothetical protein
MKYTQAIRKIYESKAAAGTDIMMVRDEAHKAGYKLFLFNGDIYFITKHSIPMYDSIGLRYDSIGLRIEDIEG